MTLTIKTKQLSIGLQIACNPSDSRIQKKADKFFNEVNAISSWKDVKRCTNWFEGIDVYYLVECINNQKDNT